MKKQIIISILIATLFLFGSNSHIFAALDPLPEANAPFNQRDRYQTDLFTGSATYTYPVKVPKGTNDLTPDVALSYSSMGVKDFSQRAGSGWQLNQDYVERDTHYTPASTNDDVYKLHFKGSVYDLVYNATDSLFHTKIESHLKIQQFLSGGQNTTGMYWQVTTPDGTLYRFGYASNSELICNEQLYDTAWSLDQVQDTHNNHIYYTYTQSNGASYLSQIKYNNDQLREIDFTYVSNAYQRQVYMQGCNILEVNNLSSIQVKANASLVHEYDLNYTQSINGQQLLSSITEKGSDGSALPATTFSYKPEIKNWSNTADLWINNAPVDVHLEKTDVVMADVNGDGLLDIVKTEKDPNAINFDTWKVLLNQGNSWSTTYQLWEDHNPMNAWLDKPDVRLRDVNGDGLPDIVRSETNNNDGSRSTWYVWKNTGSSWNANPDIWINNDFMPPRLDRTDTVLMDVNGDGLPDVVQTQMGVNNHSHWWVYKNTGSTWNLTPEAWWYDIPIDARLDESNVRLIDVNGDGLPDIVKVTTNGTYDTWQVWKNNNGGWSIATETWINNAPVDANFGMTNVTLEDVNGDGLPDIVKSVGSPTQWLVLLNKGNSWSTTWEEWINPSGPVPASLQGNTQMADVNGDTLPDIVRTWYSGNNDTWELYKNNGTSPNLLASVHTAQGGTISFDYTPSTKYPNGSNLPFPLWVVSKMTVSNGLSNSQGTSDVTTYSYKNGVYSWQNHEFRGFGEVDETDPNGAKKTYLFAQDDAAKGKLTEVDTNDAQNNPYTKTVNTWSNTQSNGIYTVNLTQEKNYTYDGSANSPKIAETDYQYDSYGNITKKSELGDTAATGDERYTYNVYTVNTSSWIVNTLSDTYVNKADDVTKVSETWNYYDNNLNLADAPTKGDLTKRVKWLSGGTNPTTTFAYESYGNKTQETDANTHTTSWSYGTTDTTHTYPDSTTNAKTQTTSMTYDLGNGNLLSKADSNGFATSYTYDAFGRVVKEIDPYDSSSYPTISYTYYDNTTAPQGTLLSKRKTSGVSGTLDTYTFVDGLGRTIQTRTPAEDTTKQIVTDTYYDPNGKVAKQSVPHLDTLSITYAAPVTGIENTIYTYDPIARIITITNPQGTTKTISYDHWTQTNTDENSHKIKKYFDAFNNISQVDEYAGILTFSTTYTYDALNNLTKTTDALSNNTNYTYDTLSRLVSLADPDMGTWNYQYDGVDNQTQQTDNRGKTTTKTYDPLNRIATVSYPSDPTVTYTYDTNTKGTLTQVQDTAGTVSYTYDNRLRKTQEARVTDGITWTTQYTYDAANRLVTQTNPDTEVLTYAYNSQGETASLSGIVNNIDYDAFGHITAKQLANSLTTNYTYSTTDFRLNRIQAGTVQDVGYTYDNVGNVASITDNLLTKTQSFTYDNLNRLVSAQETSGYNYTYAYDAIGNLTGFTNSGNTITYTYGQTAGPHALTSSTEPSPTPTPPPGITIRSASSGNNGAGSTSLTINKPTGTTNRDIMVAHVVVRTAGNAITAPSSWTLIKRQDSSSSISTATYWKLAGTSEPTSYTWTFGTSGEASGGIASYIGVDTANPVDASNAQYNSSTSTVSNAGVTTTVANDMLVLAVGITVPTTVNVPAGFMQEWSTTSSSSTTSEMSDKIDPNTGATGTISGSHNGGSNSNITHLIALKPAGSGPTPTPTNTPTPTPTPSGISLRAAASGNNGSGSTSLTINKPTGTTNGDIMVAHVVVRTAGNTITAPSGWTLILRQDSSSSISTATYWKLAGSSESANYTWTFGTSGEASGGIASYIGVNTTSPVDASNAQYNSSTSTVSNAGVTTTVANDMLVFAVGITVPTTVNVPTGFTERWSTTSSTSTTSEMSDKIDTTAGATGTISGSHNGGANSNITHLIALKPASAPAGVTGSNLTSGGGTSATSFTTASVTPSANNLLLLSVMSRTNASVEPNAPTVSGNGLTWVQVGTIYYDTDSTSRKKLTLFRSMGASPSSGAITINFGGQTQTDAVWSVDQFSGVDTTGTNGSGAVVQSITQKDETSGGGTITATLGAFSSVNNATFGAFTGDPTTDGTHPTVGSGFSQLFRTNSLPTGGNTQEMVSEWKSTNDTTVDATFSVSTGTKMGGIAVEIKAQ